MIWLLGRVNRVVLGNFKIFFKSTLWKLPLSHHLLLHCHDSHLMTIQLRRIVRLSNQSHLLVCRWLLCWLSKFWRRAASQLISCLASLHCDKYTSSNCWWAACDNTSASVSLFKKDLLLLLTWGHLSWEKAYVLGLRENIFRIRFNLLIGCVGCVLVVHDFMLSGPANCSWPLDTRVHVHSLDQISFLLGGVCRLRDNLSGDESMLRLLRRWVPSD
jgi:hypothetical protein